MYRDYIFIKKRNEIISLNLQRDFFDWLIIASSLITLLIGLYIFYQQFFKRINVKVELYKTSLYEGNSVSLLISNQSILKNLVIDEIFMVLDDFFYIDFKPPSKIDQVANEIVGILDIPHLSVKRFVFPYTSISIDGKDIGLPSFISGSHRVSFFIKDVFGNTYKSSNRIEDKKRARLFAGVFFKRKLKGDYKSFGYYRKYAGEVVVDDSIIYWGTVSNERNGTSKDFYISDYGNSSLDLYGSKKIPNESLISQAELFKYLNAQKKRFGTKDETFIISTLAKPRGFNSSFETVRDIRFKFLGKKVPYDETFNWLLIKIKDRKYMGWHNSEEKPLSNDPENLEWIFWGKKLPGDISNEVYFLKKGKLKKSLNRL